MQQTILLIPTYTQNAQNPLRPAREDASPTAGSGKQKKGTDLFIRRLLGS